MFGEHDSESPRVPSPWDPLLPSPPSESSPETSRNLQKGIPKLVPEAEEGNVEYKLKLTNISPARFARLVTQLKWRLLEGGGQAYYELGVADSGALIGLEQSDLEQSLETLEMMAGEIGASVIVVKEIEVPPIMFGLVASKYLDPHTGEWTSKMTSKRRMIWSHGSEDDSTITTAETELETADVTDFDDTPSFVSHLNTPADSVRSSPFIVPIDDDLALFSMEPEPAYIIDGVEETVADSGTSLFSVDLEIASVFKPRPARRRIHLSAGTTSTAPLKHHKNTEKVKKPQPWHTSPVGKDSEREKGIASVPNRQETKAAERRLARDRRREEKRKVLLTVDGRDQTVADLSAGVDVAPSASPTPAILDCTAAEETQQADAFVSGLDALHVAVQVSTPPNAEPVPVRVARLFEQGQDEDTALAVGVAREPRLIVEALVVRKMSIEEAFLDFEGFSLV